MTKFLNHYHCDDCETSWEDEWSCACNDRCPTCNREIEPSDSDEMEETLG